MCLQSAQTRPYKQKVAQMITLYTFGPAFHLADPSPFVTKAMMLLKMSGLDFETDRKGFNKAPKGKLPYINDNGRIIADSTFIRMHLEDVHGIDFDKGLDDKQRAIGWAFEKLCEEHLYWIAVHSRWMNDANFNKGPIKFFKEAPALIRPGIIAMVRRKVRRNLQGQGLGRHSETEIARLTARDLKAIADYLGGKPFFLGDQPSGTDATIYAFVAGALCELFDGPELTAARSHPNLIAYRDRMNARYFPDGVAAG